MGGRNNDHRGQRRDHKEAASVQPGTVLGNRVKDPEQPAHGPQRHGPQDQLRRARDPLRQCTRAPDRGQSGTQQQSHAVGVGAEVQATRVTCCRQIPGERTDSHDQRRDQRHDQRHPADTGPAAPPVQQHQGKWPKQVELLLHGQRPQVLQHRGPAHGLEVGEVRGDVPPVRHVGRRRDGVLTELGCRIPGEEQHEDGRQGQGGEQRRQQSTCPAKVELAERDRGCVFDLLQQKAADQESGQYEEHVHTEETTGYGGQPGVVQQDGQYRDRPDPVKTGDVAHLG